MESIHRVYYEFDILLAVNFIDRGEKDEIIEKVKRKVGGEEEVVEEEKIVKRSVIQPVPKKVQSNEFVRPLKNGFSEPFSKVTIEKITKKPVHNKPKEALLKEEAIWDNISIENVSLELQKQDTLATPPGPPSFPMKMANGLQIIPVHKARPWNRVSNVNDEVIVISDTTTASLLPKTDVIEQKETKPQPKLYKCGKCEKVFAIKSSLQKHEEKKFSCERKCDKCNKRFNNPGDLRTHQEKGKNCVKTVLKCEDCPKEFSSQKLFTLHKARRRTCKKQDLKCENCLKWFSSSGGLISHKNRDKPCKKTVGCEKCGKLMHEVKYAKHIGSRGCSVAIDLKCNGCLKTFASRVGARQHYKKRELKPSMCKTRIDCEKCGKRFKEEKLKVHLLRKCIFDEDDLKCKNCLKIFSTIQAAKNHKAKPEGCKKRIICEKCKKRFKEEQYKKHTIRSCIPMPCERCGERFNDFAMKKHLERKRVCNTSGLKCDVCDSILMDADTLMKHMLEHQGLTATPKLFQPKEENLVIAKEENFACTGCDKRFSRQMHLDLHQQRKKDCPAFRGESNTSEELLACPGCDKTFGKESDLKLHQQLKKDCRAYTGGTISSPPVVKMEAGISLKPLQELVEEMGEGVEESMSCWGCHKEFRNSRYLTAHQHQKKDCPAFTAEEGKYHNVTL